MAEFRFATREEVARWADSPTVRYSLERICSDSAHVARAIGLLKQKSVIPTDFEMFAKVLEAATLLTQQPSLPERALAKDA